MEIPIIITQRDVPRIMKFKKPEIRKAEDRGFRRGFIGGLFVVAVVGAAWFTLASIT